jgi:exosortase
MFAFGVTDVRKHVPPNPVRPDTGLPPVSDSCFTLSVNVPRKLLMAGTALLAAWFWASWSCAEHWRGNVNYSYGWIVPVLVAVFALRRFSVFENEASLDQRRSAVIDRRYRRAWWVALVLGLIMTPVFFALEFAREQVLHPIIVIWLIALFPVVLTLGFCWLASGKRLFLAELFPILFFLTAVPWPPRFEQPITAGLMNAVAAATTALLHLGGIPAQTSGGAITLRNGIVGITEACSGIRSLQSGIMFGLAMGEWFLLRPLKRIALLALAIALALGTNLIRTFVLSLQAEWHGLGAVENIHDLTGNLVVTAMVVAIWFCGWLLRGGVRPAAIDFKKVPERWRMLTGRFSRGLTTTAAALLFAGILGISAAQMTSAKIEARDRAQILPFFSVRHDGAVAQTRIELPREVWDELHPSSGEAIRVQDKRLGYAESYHFFWKPSPWNRFVLVHRPDICMPGVGWQSAGGPQQLTVNFSGHEVQLYLFRFRRAEIEALELWGVWRNGDPVPLDYQPDEVMRAAVAPPSLHLEGKRRSATEIVSCVIAGDRRYPPEPQRAVAILKSLFHYHPGDG